jgi:NADH-quinone oxidoreductase subunit L
MIDKAIIGGAAWTLGALAKFSGALLQRWQSGNIRSYAAWLTAGVAAVLLFIVIPILLGAYGIDIRWGGH